MRGRGTCAGGAPGRRPALWLFLAVLLTLVSAAVAPAGEPEGAVAEKVAGEVTVTETGPESPAGAGTPASPSAPKPARAAEGPRWDLSGTLKGWFGDWVVYEVAGAAVWQFVVAFLFILAGLAARKIIDFVMAEKVVPLFRRTPFQFDHLIAEAASKPLACLGLVGGLAGAVCVLRLPVEPDVRSVVYGALKVLVAADVLWFLFRMVDVLVLYLARMAARTQSKLDDHLVPLLRKALKITLAVIVAVWVVQLLGYSVGSLLAGLGIGGLAVALALQDTLANFFGSVFIFLDRPFSVGDMVKIGDTEGVVEQIGFRSTRIRTWPATLVAIPNKQVAESKIDNWSKMPKRRVNQTVGVTYETTADQMEQAVAAIRGILERDEGVDPEFIVVRFEDFGSSSLDIRVIYFTKPIAYADHLAVRERVNLAVMRALERLGLAIAFPTRTVYFEGDVARSVASRLASRPGDDGGKPG